jgi:hypothetical protein
VIFPIIKKENPDINDLHLMLYAHELANDSYLYKGVEPKPITKYRVVKTFLLFKPQKAKNQLFNVIPEVKELYEEYMKEIQGINKQPKFFIKKTKHNIPSQEMSDIDNLIDYVKKTRKLKQRNF